MALLTRCLCPSEETLVSFQALAIACRSLRFSGAHFPWMEGLCKNFRQSMELFDSEGGAVVVHKLVADSAASFGKQQSCPFSCGESFSVGAKAKKQHGGTCISRGPA